MYVVATTPKSYYPVISKGAKLDFGKQSGSLSVGPVTDETDLLFSGVIRPSVVSGQALNFPPIYRLIAPVVRTSGTRCLRGDVPPQMKMLHFWRKFPSIWCILFA